MHFAVAVSHGRLDVRCFLAVMVEVTALPTVPVSDAALQHETA